MNVYVPNEFPITAHEGVYQEVNKLRALREIRDGIRDPYRLFIGGWNAVVYRYRAVATHGRRFTNILDRWGEAPKASVRVVQEQTFHDFFANGLSCLESFAFATYQVGALCRPAQFPVHNAQLRQITPESVRGRLERVWNGNEVSIALQDLESDDDYIEWKLIRNLTTHRAIPSRLIVMGGTSKFVLEHLGGPDLDIGAEMMQGRLMWLSEQLNVLSASLQGFIEGIVCVD